MTRRTPEVTLLPCDQGSEAPSSARLPRTLRPRQQHDCECNNSQHPESSVLKVCSQSTVMLLHKRRADDEDYMHRQCQPAESAHNLRRQASLAGSY